jgi:hypothetical protein
VTRPAGREWRDGHLKEACNTIESIARLRQFGEAGRAGVCKVCRRISSSGRTRTYNPSVNSRGVSVYPHLPLFPFMCHTPVLMRMLAFSLSPAVLWITLECPHAIPHSQT